MFRHPTQILALLLVVAALAGCPSIAPMTTARPIGASKNAFGGTVGFEIAIGRIFRLMPFGGVMGWLNMPDGYEGVEAAWFTGGITSQWIF